MSKVVVEMLYGLGGASTSPGIVTLHNEIKKIPDVATPGPFDETAWNAAVQDAHRWTVEKVVLIGYSMGSNNITFMANALKPRRVALMVGIQATEWSGVEEIGGNVDKVILVGNPNFVDTMGLGYRGYQFSPDFKGTYKHILNNDSHPYADVDPAIHTLILNEIKALLS